MSQTIYDATPECDRPFTLEEIFAEMDRFEERVALDLALYKNAGYAPTEERKLACEEELADFIRSNLARLWRDKANRPAIEAKLCTMGDRRFEFRK